VVDKGPWHLQVGVEEEAVVEIDCHLYAALEAAVVVPLETQTACGNSPRSAQAAN
jgi:hypothetical protein